MSGYNRVILKGSVGADAEVKTLEGGNSVATVSIAVNESYTDKNTGERKSKVDWFRVEAWRGLATFLGTYGKVGTEFLIEGKLKNESWEKDGKTQRSTKIVAENIFFSGSKTNLPTQSAPVQAANASGPVVVQSVPVQSTPVQSTPVQAVSSSEFMNGMHNNADDDMPF